MPKFRKKPVVIEAVQLNWKNVPDICEFIGPVNTETHLSRAVDVYSDTCGEGGLPQLFIEMIIPTLEGDHIARHGDWIIKGVANEFYPCKPDIFAKTYEPVES